MPGHADDGDACPWLRGYYRGFGRWFGQGVRGLSRDWCFGLRQQWSLRRLRRRGLGDPGHKFRKLAQEKPQEFDPRKFLIPAIDAMRDLCQDRFERFGTAGNASKITPIPLADLANRYADGALDPPGAPAMRKSILTDLPRSLSPSRASSAARSASVERVL